MRTMTVCAGSRPRTSAMWVTVIAPMMTVHLKDMEPIHTTFWLFIERTVSPLFNY